MAKQLTPSSTLSGLSDAMQHPNNGSVHIPARSTPPPDDSLPYELVNMNQDLLRFADPATLNSRRTYTALTRVGVSLSQPSPPDQQLVSEGVELLNHILDIVTDIGETLLPDDITKMYASGVLGPVAWRATHPTFKTLLHDRSKARLESLSRAMFEQTARPVVFPPTAAYGALDAMLSGQNLRWEAVGIYLGQLGVWLGGERDLATSLDAHKSWKSDRKSLMLKVYRGCMQCESFCDRLGAVNDLMLWFMSISLLYATWCFGDDSYHVLRLLGTITSVFFALGYHRGVPADPVTPFYLMELRKITVAWAHDHDKCCASFTSRPPRLSRHFCVLDSPLDLPDDVLTGPAEALQEYAANLDEHGWSKDGIVPPVARLRVGNLLMPIREEALQLRNGPPIPDLESQTRRVLYWVYTLRSIDKICRRALLKLSSTWQSFPGHIRYEVAQPKVSEHDPFIILRGVRLEYLFTEFLLCALLVNASLNDHKKLIATAHEVLNLTLLPARKRQLSTSRRSDEEWSLVFYAMPCASVLVLELLRQAQNPGEGLIHNRSSIIQDISVLISCCDSLTESGQNNYQICKQAQSIFTKSLDSILNPTGPVSEYPSYGQPSDQSNARIVPEGNYLANEVAQDLAPDWTAWLESVGLQADPWLDSILWPPDFTMDQTG